MSYIRTNSEKIFDYLNIDESQIDIEDIATALSHIPRWLGHTDKFYSVAQHCCWCYDNTRGNKLEALLHDATEAYVSDIPTPLKALLPDYKEMENKVALAISNKFNFNYPYSLETHTVDKLALHYERFNIKKLDINYQPLKTNEQLKEIFNLMKYWTHNKAKREFLKRFNNEISTH
jgi:hypothetical protein